MKNPKLPCVAMMMWMALPGFGAVVQTVSETFVGSAATIPGVQGSAERIDFLALRTVRPAVYVGKVSGTAVTSITDSNANWTSAQFAGRGPLYAEFANGIEADIQQVSFGPKRLSFSGALPASITAGARYRVREHHTVAEVFGPTNQVGLLAGQNTDEAETIRHFIPETQQTRIYFYSTLSGLTGWLLDDYTPAGTTVIYPEQGLMVSRRTAANLTTVSSGRLKPGGSTVPVLPGYNMISLYDRAIPARLDELNLLSSGFMGGENADAGDNLLKINSDSTTTTYFYWNLAGFEGWYDYSYQSSSGVTIAPGTVFMIYRRPPSQVFDWTIPAQ